MRYFSLCSGMEAASKAFGPLGWQAGAFSEIDPACCDLLAHHYPDVLNLGDMTALDFIERAKQHGPYDMVCGGTPCQAFSVAGKRGGLNDDRGNLTLRFVEICDAIDPTVIFWENVPGVLSDTTNAFGCFLAGLVGADSALVLPPGQRWTDSGMVTGPRRSAAWRILDAQYFGLAQRRRRVFVVAGRAGTWADPGAILFEPDSVRRHTPPRRETGESTTYDIAPSIGASGRGFERAGESRGQDPVVACPITVQSYGDNLSRESLLVPEICNAVSSKWSKGTGGPAGDECQNLVPTTFNWQSGFRVRVSNKSSTLIKNQTLAVQQAMRVRRLLPIEVERLQGFPDNYSLVPRLTKKIIENEYACQACGGTFYSDASLGDMFVSCPCCETRNGGEMIYGTGKTRSRRVAGKLMADGPRYRMIGNSWAVPVVHWIAERIEKLRVNA